MGNCSGKFDIVTNLPPEIVAIVFSFIEVDQLLACLRVSRAWHQTIISLHPYWREKAVNRLGLYRDVVALSSKQFPSIGQFYIAARRYLTRVENARFDVAVLQHLRWSDSYTHNPPLHAQDGFYVSVTRQGKAESADTQRRIVVQRISGDSDRPQLALEYVFSAVLNPTVTVVWAYADSNHLFWLSASGQWEGYAASPNGEVELILLSHSQEMALREKPAQLSRCDVSCCDKCYLTVAVHWSHGRSTNETVCTIQLVKLGSYILYKDGGIDGGCRRIKKAWKHSLYSSHTVTVRHNHRVFICQDRAQLRTVKVLSDSDRIVEGVCQNHNLVLQCDSCTVVNPLQFPGHTLSAATCINCSHNLRLRNEESSDRIANRSCSNVCVSFDGSLLGVVCDHQLEVWQMPSQSRGNAQPLLLSRSLLDPASGEHSGDGIKLIAVGHICSLACYRDIRFLMTYRVHVVLNKTGQVLQEFGKTIICCTPCVDIQRGLFFMALNEEWLSDLCSTIPTFPLVTVNGYHDRVFIENVRSRKTKMGQTWMGHWRCAVNLTFQS